MNPTMKVTVTEQEITYEKAKKILTEYWEKCADYYVIGVDHHPIDVSINLLNLSKPRFIVLALEISRIKHYKNCEELHQCQP